MGDKERAEFLDQLGTVGPKTEKAAKRKGAKLRTVAKTAIKEWTQHGNLKLADHQLEGAVSALVDPVSVLTGLPGTGKTTTLKVVVKVLQDANVPFLLVAPTGIAAKRLTSVTGAEASTIHRAFGAKGMETDDERESTYAGIVGSSGQGVAEDGSKEFWEHSSNNPHPAKVVIVDESSMVDQHLLFRLLTCTAKTCRLVFVGDADQLPSVGPGNVLRDLISSELFPVTALREIFRQDEASDIVIAAHAINRGDKPEFEKGSKDFVFAEVRNEHQILDTITATVQKLYEKRANFQVLSPRHSGTLGVTNLNLRIRELLNPKTPGLREMRLGQETVREGDRVMVSKNNYRYEIFNGDVGKVMSLDQKEKIVAMKIHGPPVMQVHMKFKDAPQYLRMAYCVTVHKSQGQEYDVILMPWSNSFRFQLQRNLLYTAITRARKKVILVGHPEALKKAVDNNKVDARNTLFPDRLRELLG
jgi:exodeoxyribonuclease V alpha subunit